MAATRRAPAVRAALVAAFVLACLPLLGRAALVESTSWIDAPLDGAVLPLAAYEVVAHSADQAGIAEVVFQVDGAQAASLAGDGASRLLTSRFRWIPAGPGTYVLTVLARNPDGAWAAPASATVMISDTAPTPGPTLEPGASPDGSPVASSTPGPTLEPGQTPGPTATPGPTKGATPAPTPTPPPGPTPTPCFLPTPTNVSPRDLTTYNAIESGVEVTVAWSLPGEPACLAGYTISLSLDQQIPDYASGGYSRTYDVAADTTFYTFPVFLQPDLSEWNQCGFYFWQVWAFDGDGEVGEPSNNWQIKVCFNPDG